MKEREKERQGETQKMRERERKKQRKIYFLLGFLKISNSMQPFLFKIYKNNWAPVTHACNPSYSGGRDQDCSSKPAPGK
jgi:hypothetical protein